MALVVGTWDVDSLLEQIPAETFSEWIAFYRIEPFGEPWLQTSYLCSIVRNLVATKQTELVKMDHFVPSFGTAGKRPEQFDAAAHEAKMAAMFGNI